VCTGTPVYYEQMGWSGHEWPGSGQGVAREEDVANVYGYTGVL